MTCGNYDLLWDSRIAVVEIAQRIFVASGVRLMPGDDFPSIREAQHRYAHGTGARYVLARCRCKDCRDANRTYERERVASRRPPYQVYEEFLESKLMRTKFQTVVAAGCLIALTALTSVSYAAVNRMPSPRATAPPRSVVTRLCVTPHTDMELAYWNFLSDYLLCSESDQNTGGINLFHRLPNGSFALIKGEGGDLPPTDLVDLGVPASVASALYNGLHR